HQLVQIEQQLIQVQELAGQSQQQLASLRQQVNSRERLFAAPPDTQQAASQPAAPGSGADPEELYRVGMAQLQRGNASVARQAFEQLVREHVTHERAPDAQLQLA